MEFLYNKKAIINYLVWIINLLPFYIIKYEHAPIKEATNFVLVEGFFYVILVVTLTFGIQFLVEKYDKVGENIFLKAMKIIVYIVLASLIFNLIMFPFSTTLSQFMQPNLPESATRVIYNSYTGNIFIWFIWYIVYTLFQLLEKLNLSRVKSAELATNLRDSQLNALKGQLNPHFIFNSLNNIRGLILEDAERSRDSLTRLSEMLRYSLVKSNDDSISLEEELEMVRNFIEISKIQFENRLEYKEEIDPLFLTKLIPPMIIQILVENATKHGISNLKEGGIIHVFAGDDQDKFIIRVRNTGKLAFAQNSTKLGLQNIKKRLELMYGSNASFSLQELNNEVIAEIKIP